MANSIKNHISSGPGGTRSKAGGDLAHGFITVLTDEELDHFQRLILERRLEAKEEIERMHGRLTDAREYAEDDSAYSFHMADAGTDAQEREILYSMLARQKKYIGYLDRALKRIADKTYGMCKVTGKPISKDRLEAIPHTEISIEAKRKQMKGHTD